MNMKELAYYALDSLKKAGADKAVCRVGKGRTDEFNVEANEFTLLRTLFNDGISLKALVNNRKGTVSINKLEKDAVDKAVAECIEMAKMANPDEAEDIAPKSENKSFSFLMDNPDIDKLFGRSKEFMEQVKDEYPKIILESLTAVYSKGESYFINSNGVEYFYESDNYNVGSGFVAKDGEKSSSMNWYGTTQKSLDNPLMNIGLQRQLLDESVKGINARNLDGKFVGKIIVSPLASDMVWGTMVGCFLSEWALLQGTSRWKDALNTKVVDENLTFSCLPFHPAIINGERYTGDGFLSQDMDFIKDGVLKSFSLSLYGANKTGKPRSLNNGGSWYIKPGEKSLDEMIKSIDKGIILNRFSGASPGPSGDVSGVAKNSFLIENGKITDAINETMVSFNVVDVLQNISAISKDVLADGGSILPWCMLDGVTVSGK